jgi:thioesterase domain-containing protein/acyl carrier protein
MLPSAFVWLDALPLTASGKLDRQALPAPGAAPASKTHAPPRDRVELQLSRIWQSILGLEEINIQDNFFELGGHSLLAVQLVTRVSKMFGRALPLASLFQEPTIEQMAKALRRQRDGSTPHLSLVPIQPQGSRPPLFLAHPAGGQALCYHDLARRLGPDQPVYAFQAPGLDGFEPPFTRIEALAERYCRELRDIQPAGPYQIAGWSFGGNLAYEMACQLEAYGNEVAFLGVIDASADMPVDAAGDDYGHQVMLAFAEMHGLALDEVWHSLTPDRQLEFLIDRAKELHLVPPDFGQEQAQWQFEVLLAHNQAMRAFVPRRFNGAVTLFKAEDWRSSNETGGWSTTARVEIVPIIGTHLTLIYEPHVKYLTEQMISRLA